MRQQRQACLVVGNPELGGLDAHYRHVCVEPEMAQRYSLHCCASLSASPGSMTVAYSPDHLGRRLRRSLARAQNLTGVGFVRSTPAATISAVPIPMRRYG